MKSTKPHLEGIIFDMDGTIIDTEHVWESATEAVLLHCGIHKHAITPDKTVVFEKMAGIGVSEAMELIRDNFEVAHVTKQEMTKVLVESAKKLLEEEIKFIHGFEEFHRKLQAAGIPSSIATNCDAESLLRITKKMSFNEFFGEYIYCVADVNNKAKPDPALFLHAAEKINAKPDKCIVFEDSLPGFRAAAAAQMKCIAVKNKKNIGFFGEHTHGYIESYTAAEAEVIRIVEAYLREKLKEK